MWDGRNFSFSLMYFSEFQVKYSTINLCYFKNQKSSVPSKEVKWRNECSLDSIQQFFLIVALGIVKCIFLLPGHLAGRGSWGESCSELFSSDVKRTEADWPPKTPVGSISQAGVSGLVPSPPNSHWQESEESKGTRTNWCKANSLACEKRSQLALPQRSTVATAYSMPHFPGN